MLTMSSNWTEKIVLDIDKGIAAGHALDKHICLVKLPESTNPVYTKDFHSIEVAVYKLWPALVFDSFNDLLIQLPPNSEMHHYMESNIRPIKHQLTEEYGVAYLIGKGSVICIKRNKHGGILYLDDGDNIDYERDSVFDFLEHVGEMKGASKGYCASVDFQYAYNLAQTRIAECMTSEDDTPAKYPDTKNEEDITSSLPDDGSNVTTAPSKPTSYFDVLKDYVCQGLHISAQVPPINSDCSLTARNDTHNTEAKDVGVSRSSNKAIFDGGDKVTNSFSDSSKAKDCNNPATIGHEPVEMCQDEDPSRLQSSPLTKDDKFEVTKKKKTKKIRERCNQNNTSHKRFRQKMANNVEVGSRIIENPAPKLPDGFPKDNERRCLLLAILAHIPDQHLKSMITQQFVGEMSISGDTPISVGINALAHHGMTFKHVTAEFNHGCRAFNLFQVHQSQSCKLIVVLRLWQHKWYTDHCIAWDGCTLHDHPYSATLLRGDRSNNETCMAVFERLYPKNEYSRWQITQVFELVEEVQSNDGVSQKECLGLGEKTGQIPRRAHKKRKAKKDCSSC